MRLADIDTLPVILACYSAQGLRWSKPVAHIPRRWWLRSKLDEDSFAHGLLASGTRITSARKQPGAVWFENDDAENYSVTEDCIPGKAGEVLTRDLLPRVGFLIGGERALLREIADAVLGTPDAAGYGIHTLMNRCGGRSGIPVKVVFMGGCDHRQKFQKWGPWEAAMGMFHLISQVARTWLKTMLVPSRIPQLNFDPPEFGRRTVTPSRTPGEVEG